MKNKRNLLLVAAMCLTIGMANASSLVRVDIRRASDSAIDLTCFTTGSASTPMVTRKSSNKYVILMPNVSGNNSAAPSIASVKDLIADVNIKNVDDGVNGYTKITLITTKPINISTHVQYSGPVSNEEQQARDIIAQIKTKPQQATVSQTPVPEAQKVVNKAPETSNKKEIKKPETKTETKKAEAKKTETRKTEVPKVAKKNTETKTQPKEIQTIQPAAKTNNIPAPIVEQKQPVKETINETKPVETITKEADSKINFKEIDKIEKKAKKSGSSHKSLALLLLPAWLLYLAAKGIRNSIQKSKALKSSFNEHLSEKPVTPESYENIINDSDLSWQEKYKKFVEESKDEVPNDESSDYDYVKSVNQIDEKRLELENTLNKTPEIYKDTEIKIDDEIQEEVKSEDNAIQKDIIKLKAFANPVSLHTSHRNKIKKEFPQLPKAKEGKFVQLKESGITYTSRKFKDGALSVSDLINTTNKYIETPSTENIEQNYVMSSIDEYFSILDKEKELVKASDNLSSKIADSLSSIKPSISLNSNSKSAMKNVSNPIKQTTSNIPEGLIIKSGYNIDENRGFYIANVDGMNSLVGRVGNETTVIKTFNSNVDKLQVRRDSENVYIVKAGSFKALVDVTDDKMGVLLEI